MKRFIPADPAQFEALDFPKLGHHVPPSVARRQLLIYREALEHKLPGPGPWTRLACGGLVFLVLL